MKRKKLVILGAGFGSFRLASGISTEFYDVTIVSPRDHFLFTPLLASTTVGTLEFRSIIEPIRTVQRNLTVFHAACTEVDAAAGKVRCAAAGSNGSFELGFDLLVIGVGAIVRDFGVPGVREFAMPLKELADARLLRQRIVHTVEQAALPNISESERRRRLHFVVVGGGPTGVEFAGELHDFVHSDLRAAFPALIPLIEITLLDASPMILSSFSASLSEYALKAFRKRKIDVRLATPVAEVRADAIVLKDGSVIPCGIAIWSAGIGPTALTDSLAFAKDPSGRIITDDFLHVSGHDNIYALGDCAVIPARSYPGTAQVAQQQGKYLAHTLNAEARGQKVAAFRFRNLGMLAYIGGQRALADTPGIKWRGFIAWILWRSVYLTKLVSFKNKVRVLFDWIKARIFGRDITSF